ncbi:MAG: sigma-70 family RNA polymerase sigma factor [Micrococcales bacterium]|nr:sigma-70 family RNA polymerase sigma factor [Micrococcales bacterium]
MTTPVTTEARVEELFNQHVDAVFRFCRVQLNEALAQEVTSDVFVVAWQKLDQVPPDCALAWLLGVARRLMAFQLRGERRRRALITKISSEPRARRSEPDPADAIAGADLAQRAMASLSHSDQSLLWLAATQDLSQDELGQALGIGAKAAGVRLSRARARLTKAVASASSPEPVDKQGQLKREANQP